MNTLLLYVYSFVGCFLYAHVGTAQIDSTYIQAFDTKFAIRFHSGRDFVQLTHKKDAIEHQYIPNNPVNIGGGILINNLLISYDYGFGFMRNSKKGNTKSFDLQLHNYGRKFVFDVFIQRYHGFYTADEDDDNESVVLYPDLKIQQYSALGLYLLNNCKFSYRAAFNQSERQLQSAGSVILGIGGSLSAIQFDSVLLADEHTINNIQFGVNAGYAYTYIIKKDYFVSGSATLGISVGNNDFDRIRRLKLNLYQTTFLRFATGYQHKKWSIALSYINNMQFPSLSNNKSLLISSGQFQIAYTRRLK